MKNDPMICLFLPNPLVRKVENKEFLWGKKPIPQKPHRDQNK